MEIIKSVKRQTFAVFLALIAASSLGMTGWAANASASNSIASQAYQQTQPGLRHPGLALHTDPNLRNSWDTPTADLGVRQPHRVTGARLQEVRTRVTTTRPLLGCGTGWSARGDPGGDGGHFRLLETAYLQEDDIAEPDGEPDRTRTDAARYLDYAP